MLPESQTTEVLTALFKELRRIAETVIKGEDLSSVVKAVGAVQEWGQKNVSDPERASMGKVYLDYFNEGEVLEKLIEYSLVAPKKERESPIAKPEAAPPTAEPEVAAPTAQVETAAPSYVVETPEGLARHQAPVVKATEPDDLKRIEGIGPKIASLLQAAGITTFAHLASTDVRKLKKIIAEAGLTALADPTTWPEQATLAATGEWDALEALQDELKGGRRA